MASVIKRGEVFYIKVRKLSGKGFERRRTDARTEPQALRLALDLEAKRERQREGLEPMEVCEHTLGELCRWWLKTKCKPRSLERETSRLGKWVLKTSAGDWDAPRMRHQDFERWFIRLEQKEGASASTVNHLRAVLRSVFTRAMKAGLWNANNPLQLTEKRTETPKTQEPLAFEEVPLFLAHVPPRWRALCAVAICTGLRKSELFGLRRASVELERKAIVVRHSYDHETTKGGHVDAIPLPEVVLPYLRQALSDSEGSELVFPGPDGKTQDGDDAKLSTVVKRALKRAGLVKGYLHTCRRCTSKGLKHEETHPDAEPRWCPTCEVQLWPKAIPRALTFHGLRHTSATMMLRAGASLAQVQRILRHRDPKLTASTYGHLLVEDLREAINKPWGTLDDGAPSPMGPEPESSRKAQPAPTSEGAAALDLAGCGPTGVQAAATRTEGLEAAAKTSGVPEGYGMSRAGIEPATLGLKVSPGEVGRPWQTLATPENHSPTSPTGGSSPLQSLADLGTSRGPPGVQTLGPKKADAQGPQARTSLSIRGVRALLTVADVAELLQFAPDTVYLLVKRGELRAVRLGAAVRIRPEDLEAFLAKQVGPGRDDGAEG